MLGGLGRVPELCRPLPCTLRIVRKMLLCTNCHEPQPRPLFFVMCTLNSVPMLSRPLPRRLLRVPRRLLRVRKTPLYTNSHVSLASLSPLSRLSLASLSPLSRVSLASLSPLSRLSLDSLSPLSRLSLANCKPGLFSPVTCRTNSLPVVSRPLSRTLVIVR